MEDVAASPPPAAPGRRKARLFGLAKFVLSAALVVWLVQGVDTAALGARLQAASPATLVLAGALELVAILVLAVRWRMVLATLGLVMPYVTALRLSYIGLFINQVLPANVGGDVYRVWHVFRDAGQLMRALMAVALDRLVALVGLALLAVPGIFVMFHLTADRVPVLVLIAMVGSIAAGTSIFLALGSPALRRRVPGLGYLSRVLSWVTEAATLGRAVFLAPGPALKVIGASVIGHGLAVAALLVLAQGLNISLGIGAALALVPPVILVSVMPVSYGGWGLREGAMAIFLGFAGVAPVDAISLSLLFGGINFLLVLPAALWWLGSPTRRVGNRIYNRSRSIS